MLADCGGDRERDSPISVESIGIEHSGTRRMSVHKHMSGYSFSLRSSSAIAAPNAVARAEAAMRATGTPLLHLSDSNPTHTGLAPASLPMRYDANPRGALADRRALADAIGTWWAVPAPDPEQLYLLSSTSQAYSWLFKLLCDSGDVILAPAPGYPLVEQIAALENVHVRYYRLAMHERWAIDVAHIEELLIADRAAHCRVKAIVVINPGNPTGAYIHADERERLVDVCSRFSLPLIADEVFWGYPLAGTPADAASGDKAAGDAGGEQRVVTAACALRRVQLAGERRLLTFGLDGLSKNLGAPGAKVAWIYVSGPHEIVRAAQLRLDAIADAFLPMSDIISTQLPALLAEVPRQRRRVQERCHENLALLQKLVAADPTGVTSVITPEGGWNALVRFPATVDENALVTALIRGAGESQEVGGSAESSLAGSLAPAVTVQPGYFFDMPIPGFVNISLLLEPQQLTAGVSALLAEIARRVQDA